MTALADKRLAEAEASAGSKSFRHRRSSLVARGRASHSSNDVIVNPRAEAVIEGKFAYGRVSKDLEDDDVSLSPRFEPPVGKSACAPPTCSFVQSTDW